MNTKNISMFLKSDQAVLPETALRFQVDLAARLAQHDMVWGAPSGPPASWKEGAPLGNGDFGALVYGAFDNLSFALGKTDLWDRSGPGKTILPAANFKEFRQTYFDQDEAAYKRFCAGISDNHVPHATTAGMFRLHLYDADCVMSQTLRVSLFEGIARLSGVPSQQMWKPTEAAVEMFVSRAYNLLVVRVRPGNLPLSTFSWELSRELHAPHPQAEVGKEASLVFLRQRFTTGDEYAVAVSFAGGENSVAQTKRRIMGDITINKTPEILIYLTIVTNRDAADILGEARARLKKAQTAGFEVIAGEHRAWWQKYWKRSYVCIGDQAAEKWWYTSLYLCGSTFEPGRQSPGLQGVWIKENMPAWWGDYHCNCNLQAQYSGLFSTNRLDLLEPYVRLLQSVTEHCRKVTREYFQMRGIWFPLAFGIDGYAVLTASTTPWANLSVSVGSASWLTQLLWQAYEYTGDRDYLREAVYPLLRDAALFYEDYLIWDEKAGRYAVEPSVHFEALMPSFTAWGKNSLYEVTLLHSAFRRAVAAAEVLGVDEDARQRWRDVIKRLPDPPADAEGKIWINFEGRDVRDRGSHQHSLVPVFPGELVSLWHGPPKWREQALATWHDPVTPQTTCSGTAWCGGQGIREIIRLGDVDNAMAAVRWPGKRNKWLMRIWPDQGNINGLNHTWRSLFLQADHGPGMCSVLSDMLVLGLDGIVRLFPCFPKNVPAAFHSLRVPGWFLVSAEKRGEEVDYVLIQSLAGNDLGLANPWPVKTARVRDAGTDKEILSGATEILRIPTQAGEVLIVDRPDKPYEKIAFTRYA